MAKLDISEKIKKHSEIILLAVQALRPVMDSWKKSCFDVKGNPNIEFLAEFEMNLAHLLEENVDEITANMIHQRSKKASVKTDRLTEKQKTG